MLEFVAARIERLGDRAGQNQRDCRAVFRRKISHESRQHVAAGARHVGGDDVGRAGNVFDNVARQQPRVGIVAAAHRAADIKIGLLL